MKVIKRYPNRLLYDPDIGRFVTGESLRNYVRCGVEFEIVESHSGQDVTVPVLSQVLVEDLNRSHNQKSVIQVIRGFIALKGEMTMDILKKTILASIGVFEITKSKAEEIIDTLIKQGEIAKSKRSDAILELLDKAEESSRNFKEKVSKDIETVIENLKVAKKKDLEKLNKKVDDLSASLKELLDKMASSDNT
ncbi:MAG: hypothetical protein KAT58_04580 [candidate division Zixibacteria bacterium]|nr:hypothetical protein [candidate division Zixibacteria bacterium]